MIADDVQYQNVLELYFYPGKHDQKIFSNGVDVNLIRMVIPPCDVVYGPGAINVEANVPAAYAYMTEAIFNHGRSPTQQNPGLSYDVRKGAGGGSHYITVGPTGHVLNLTSWINRMKPWTNCADLMHICTLACRAFGLQSNDTTPVSRQRFT